jgi:transposase
MGQKELLRGKLMEMVKQGKMRLKAAALKIKVSYRQGKRIYAAYLGGGDRALIHGNTGRPSNRRLEEEIRGQAVSRYQQRYSDFGPAFAAEKLEEETGLRVSADTLRRWFTAEVLWKGRRRRRAYRSRRERRPCFGELVQFDGSHHDWFEGRGPRCCLITMIDDATNIRYSRFF